MNKTIIRSSGGYTFIELLIAIAILGMIVSPFLMMFTGSYLSINSSGNQSIAINLCRQQVEKIKALGYDSALSNYSADKVNINTLEENIDGFPGFKRLTIVKPYIFTCTNNPELDVELLLIEVSVTWKEGKSERQEILKTLLSNR